MDFSLYDMFSFVVSGKIGRWDVREVFSREEKGGRLRGEADGKTVGGSARETISRRSILKV